MTVGVGKLAVGKMRLRLVFDIARDSNNDVSVVYMDVPVQGLRHYRMETSWDSDCLALTVSARAFGKGSFTTRNKALN